MTIVIVTSLCDAASAGEDAPRRARVDERRHRLRAPCKHRDRVAALQQIPRHRRPHRAEPDYSDVCHVRIVDRLHFLSGAQAALHGAVHVALPSQACVFAREEDAVERARKPVAQWWRKLLVEVRIAAARPTL